MEPTAVLEAAGRRQVAVAFDDGRDAVSLVLAEVAPGEVRLAAPAGDLDAGVRCRQVASGTAVQLSWGDGSALHVVDAVARGFDRDADALVVVPAAAGSRQRRDNARAPLRLAALAAWLDGGRLAQLDGFTRNVSPGGIAFCAVAADLHRMAAAPDVLVALSVGNDVVRAVGKVLEVLPAPGFARVQFTQLADRDATTLQRAVQAELIERRRRVQ